MFDWTVKNVQPLLINITLSGIQFFAVEYASSATVSKTNFCNLFCPCRFSCRSGIRIHIVRCCWNQAHDGGEAAAAECPHLALLLHVWASYLTNAPCYHFFLMWWQKREKFIIRQIKFIGTIYFSANSPSSVNGKLPEYRLSILEEKYIFLFQTMTLSANGNYMAKQK